MRNVATLPFNLRHTSKFGFYSLYIYTDWIKHVYNYNSVIAIGGSPTDSERASLESNLKLLTISPDSVWREDEIHDKEIKHCFFAIQEKSIIEEWQEDISSCSCGMVEYRSLGKINVRKNSLITEGGNARCCGSYLKKTLTSVLLLGPLSPPDILPEIYPLWAKREVEFAYAKIRDKKFLISRTHPRTFSARVGEKIFWLDNDVSNLFFLNLLSQKETPANHLISGVSLIHQTALMLALCPYMGIAPPEKIHFLPRVRFSPVAGVESITQAVAKFGVHRIKNALLYAALSEKKEMTLSGSIFPKMYDGVPPMCCADNIRTLFKR